MKSLCLTILIAGLLPWPTGRADERAALVIGVSDYKAFGKLDNPRQDHAEMVRALKALGFSVTDSHNPTLQQIEDITRQFVQSHEDAKEVVFYFSGHGLQVQGRNYLTGIDSSLDVMRGLEELENTSLKGDALIMAKEAHIRQTAESTLAPLDKVLALLDHVGQRGAARVIILDCCRDNPLGSKSLVSKSVLPPKGGLGKVDAPRGMLIAFAAREGKTAAQTELGQPSLYTMALLKHIHTPGLEAEQVFKRTRATVLELSQDEQEPAEYTNLTGNLVFSRSAPGSAASVAVVAAAGELPMLKAGSADQSGKTGADGEGTGAPPPELPERGYFDLDALFSQSAYAAYNTYSKGQILRRVQNFLRQDGLYAGVVDGLPGRGTQQALLAWQRKNLAMVTGRLESETLGAMKLTGLPQESRPQETVRAAPTQSRPRQRPVPGASAPPPAAPAPARPVEMSPDEFLRRARALEN